LVPVKRLQLCQLGEEGRKAFFEGKLTAGVAHLVARVPASVQDDVVAELAALAEPATISEARGLIEGQYMLQLGRAQFDPADASLPGGACHSCPKRTGSQPDLFGDIESPDTCTDPVCYRGKVDATWDKRARSAPPGVRVLGKAECQKLWPSKYTSAIQGAGLVDLDAQTWVGDKMVSNRKLLGGKKAKEPPP
jgi:hypothetical protein